MQIMSFKDLKVWQKSMVLAKVVYKLTSALPKSELYGLVSQMRRCSVSIPSNIAEGRKRRTKGEYVHFLGIADASAAELETQLLLVKDLYKMDIAPAERLLIEVQKMLITLIKQLRR